VSDDYTQEPVTLTEFRARKEGLATIWTVRDALVNTLRRIDAGEFVPENMVMVIETEENYISVTATCDQDKTIALLYRGLREP